MIPLKVHNVIDYILGVALVATPYVFDFSHIVFARTVFLVLGVGLIGYSLITDYYYSLAKILPLSMHMTFDVVAGVFVMLAPSIYGYREDLTGFQNALHFVYGLGAIGLVALTRQRTVPPELRAHPPLYGMDE